MTPVLPVTAEFAASLSFGGRSMMILPFTQLRSTILTAAELAVLEPFCGSDVPVYAADHTTAYGWKAAIDMPLEWSRMSLTINRVRLVYCSDLTDRDFLQDGVWQQDGAWVWQLRTGKPVRYVTAKHAWMAHQKVTWGRRDGGDRVTKSLVVSMTVNMVGEGRKRA